MRRAGRTVRTAAALLLGAVVPACAMLGLSDEAIAENMLANLPPGTAARAYTLDVTGKTSTLFTDTRAFSLLQMSPGVLQVKRGVAGSCHVVVVVDEGISSETLALRLGDEYRVRVVGVTEQQREGP